MPDLNQSTLSTSNTIVDSDIATDAAINKTKISGTAITAADTGTVTSAMILDGTIENADVNALAAIAHNKLANASVGQVLLGTTTTGVITATAISGDITIDGAGTATIAANSVALGTDTTGNYVADVTAGAGITVTHAPGEGSSASVALNAALDDLNNVSVPSPTTGHFLKWDGSSWVAAAAGAASTTTSITANTATTVDSFALSSFRSAQFMVTATQGSKYTTIQAIILHDGTTAQLSQYGIIEIGSPIIPLTLSADISGSDVRLRATITDAATTNAEVKVLKTAL